MYSKCDGIRFESQKCSIKGRVENYSFFSLKVQKLSKCVNNTFKIAIFLSLMKVCQSNQAKFTEKIDPNRSQKHSSGKGWTDWVSTLLMFHQMSSKDQT